LLVSHAPSSWSDRQPLDALTSEIPTFPYTANECQKFIELLQCGKGMFHSVHFLWHLVDRLFLDHASSPYITTFVARLWAIVGKFHAPKSSLALYDLSFLSKPSLLYVFRRRSLPPVLLSSYLGGTKEKAKHCLGNHIKDASFGLA